jgi:hypothetical protein
MTGSGQFVEFQDTGEQSTFNQQQLTPMLGFVRSALRLLTAMQQQPLGRNRPFG